MCIYTHDSSSIVFFPPFSGFRQNKEEKTHAKKKEREIWAKGKNLYLQNELIFLGTLVFKCFMFLKAPSFQRETVLPEWWLPDVSVPDERLPSLVSWGNVGPICLYFFWLSMSFKKLARGLHLLWFDLSAWFSCSYYPLFSQWEVDFWCGNTHPHKNESLINFKREWLLIIDEVQYSDIVELDYWYYEVAKLCVWTILKNTTT